MSPDLERLIGRAIAEPEFRRQLLLDPVGVVEREGYALTEEELKKVREAADDPAAEQKLGTLGGRGGVWG